MRKASPPASSRCGDRPQRPVALLVAERVVQLLEAVEVEQADAEPAAAPELSLQPLLEPAPVAQPGERVGRGRAHRLERAQHRTLVQVVGHERREQEQRQQRLGLPQHDQDQRERGHDHQHQGRGADRLEEQRQEPLPLGPRDDERDQEQIDGVEGGGGCGHLDADDALVERDRRRARRRSGERVDGGVVGEAEQRLPANRLHQQLHGEGDDGRGLPAVQRSRADDEQARERGRPDRDPLDRERKRLGDRSREQQGGDPQHDAQVRPLDREPVGRRHSHGGTRRDDGRDHGQHPPQTGGCLGLRLKQE